LTAIANWTGRASVSGAHLGLLVLLCSRHESR
jgi:uncharacterized protein involved in response to NO